MSGWMSVQQQLITNPLIMVLAQHGRLCISHAHAAAWKYCYVHVAVVVQVVHCVHRTDAPSHTARQQVKLAHYRPLPESNTSQWSP